MKMIKKLLKKSKATRKLTAVIVDLRDRESFDIVAFDDIFSLFDYLDSLGITGIKYYNYDPKEGRIIITYPISLSEKK